MASSQSLKDSLAGIQEKLTAIESQLEIAKKEIESRLKALDCPPQLDQGTQAVTQDSPSLAAGLELKRVNAAHQKLATGKTQEQILATYLEEAQALVSRGVLFLKEDQKYRPWKAIGFDLEHVQTVEGQDPGNPILRAAMQRQIVFSGGDLDQIFPWSRQSGVPSRVAVCIPLVFGDSVPVVLYADSSASIPLDSLELLTHLVVLVLKNHYLQRLGASEEPTSSPEGENEGDSSEWIPPEIQEIPEASALVPDLPSDTSPGREEKG